ncbi:MAG: SEFIR domain-containing protein [Bacillota bacterium]
MKNSTNNPKIFISYSWTDTEYKDWVREIAERLVSDGIDVILDQWDLKEGQDKYSFMEQMVNSKDIDKVLIFCNRIYAKKANKRQGGVGTESQIISPEIYNKIKQEKFLPIVTEIDNNGQAFLPSFLSSRIYFNFSDRNNLYDEYEKLLRNLYNRPSIKKPKLGTAPSYIFESEPNIKRTTHIFKNFKDSIIHDKPISKGFLSDYITCFIASYEEFKIDFNEDYENDDQKIYDEIGFFLKLKNEFVDLLCFLGSYTKDMEFYKQIFSLFEKILKYNFNRTDQSYRNYYFDNFKFYCYELFLNLTASLIKFQRFDVLKYFLSEKYFYKNLNQHETSDYSIFENYLSSLEELRKKRLESKRLSITADLIKERATKEIPFEKLMEAELLLFFKGVLFYDKQNKLWYPRTLVFANWAQKFELFIRSESNTFFINLLIALDIESKDELIKRWNIAKEQIDFERFKWNFGFRFPGFEGLLNIDKLGTI